MAYITRYTLSKLARRLYVKEKMTEQIFVEHIFNDKRLYQFFNKLEMSYLFNYRKLLENSNLEYYVEVPIQKDNGKYVFQKDSQLKYHLFSNCEFLNKDFKGYVIPEEIREKNLINEYREWFKENNFREKYEEDKERLEANIINRYNNQFRKRYNLKKLNFKYKLIEERPNGNKIHTERSFNTEEFYDAIEKCIQYKNNLLNTKEKRILGKWTGIKNKSDSEIKEKIIELVGSEFLNTYGLENIKDIWESYAKVKIGVLMKHLIEYFKWTYSNNPTLYDRYTLESFNLACCNNCKKLEVESKNNMSNTTDDNDLPF